MFCRDSHFQPLPVTCWTSYRINWLTRCFLILPAIQKRSKNKDQVLDSDTIGLIDKITKNVSIDHKSGYFIRSISLDDTNKYWTALHLLYCPTNSFNVKFARLSLFDTKTLNCHAKSQISYLKLLIQRLILCSSHYHQQQVAKKVSFHNKRKQMPLPSSS